MDLLTEIAISAARSKRKGLHVAMLVPVHSVFFPVPELVQVNVYTPESLPGAFVYPRRVPLS